MESAATVTENPLMVVQHIRKQQVNAGDEDIAVSTFFRQKMDDRSVRELVPEVPAHCKVEEVPVGRLVRLRGVITDTLDPEFYCGTVYLGGSNGPTPMSLKYGAVPPSTLLPEGNGNPSREILERYPFVLTSLSAESAWATSAAAGQKPVIFSPSLSAAGVNELARGGTKRSREDDEMCVDDELASSKSLRDADASMDVPTTPALAPECAADAAFCCLVRAYTSDPMIRVNSLVEVFGILEVDPESAEFGSQGADSFTAPLPPTSVMPRVHMLSMRKLSSNIDVPDAMNARVSADLSATRESLVQYLAQACGGCSISGEMLLLSALSSVTARTQDSCVGKLTLNLRACSQGILRSIYQALGTIFPRVVGVDASVESLNKIQLAPRKDYSLNRICPGVLQVGDGSVVVVDETKLAEGKLAAEGVANLQALASVARRGKLPFDFQYYKVDIDVDMPVIVLSDGRTILPHDASVRLDGKLGEGAPQVADDQLWMWRSYVSMARGLRVDVGDDVATAAQEAFCAARKADPSVGPEILNQWLTMTKSIASSLGQSVATIDTWNHAVQLESRCRASCAQVAK